MKVNLINDGRWRKYANIFNTTSAITIYQAWVWRSTIIKLSIFDADITQIKNSVFILYRHQYTINEI